MHYLMGMNIDELVVLILGAIIVIGIVTSIFKGLFGIAKIAGAILIIYLLISFFTKMKL